MIKEAGTYRARAAEVMLGQSKTKGTPFVGIRFSITDGPYKGEMIKWEGYLTSTTDKKGKSVAERTIESLQHCGWTGDDLSVFTKGLNGLDSNEVDLVIDMEEYDGENAEFFGKHYPKVRWVNRLNRGGSFVGNSMDVAQAAAFGQKFRGLALAVKAKAGATGASMTSDAAPIDADELPF